jgi:hypothetical protein
MPSPSGTLENNALTGEANVVGDGVPVHFSQATAEGQRAISLHLLAQPPAGQISYKTITW